MSKKLSKDEKLSMKTSKALHDELSMQLFSKPEALLNISEQTKLDRYINDYLHPIWKVIATKHGYQVEVSNVGRVRDPVTKKPYKIYYANDGKYGFIYIPSSITGGKICIEHVHVLVAMAFCSNPENKTDVNHINTNKRCNWWENLEWVTPKENVEHAIINGLINNTSKYTIDQIRNVCKDIVNYPTKSLKKIAEENGVSVDIVELINARKAWKSISKDYEFPDRSSNIAHNGESNGNSKYTEELINEMCNIFDDVHSGKSNLSLKEIANKLQVPLTLVRDVYRGKTWRCVSAHHTFATGQTIPLRTIVG